MPLSKGEREDGYRATPQPDPHMVAILRRVARGHLTLTQAQDKDGNDASFFAYDDGTPVRDIKGRAISREAVTRATNAGWLIPVNGESLLADGPPQRYRARRPEDGPLPRFTKS